MADVPAGDATVTIEILTPLARALADTIASYPKRRVELTHLRTAYARHDPTGAASTNARVVLAATLDSLAVAGMIRLPRSPRLHERHLHPPLPLWVERAPAPREPVQLPRPRVWREELAAAADLARTPEERSVLEAIDLFIRDGGTNRPEVPHRERSLELFGHEKRLDALLRTRLFTSGALNLALLRAYIAPLPLTASYVTSPGSTPTLLLVENHNTYASALRVARDRARAGLDVPAIGWTDGNRAAALITGATQLDPIPVDIVYFGDLDAAGLRIPVAASAAAVDAGLPPARPATALYRELLRVGTVGAAKGGPVSPDEAARLTPWLADSNLAHEVMPLLVAGNRLAQEAVGYDRLSAISNWC